MVSKRFPNVVVAAVCILSFGVIANAAAASVWVPTIQLEQFWSGGQWKDTVVDTTAWLDPLASSSIIHAVSSNPNGLIRNYITLNQYDSDKEMIQQLMQSYDKAQGEWADTISGSKWTRLKDANKRDTIIERQSLKTTDKKWYKVSRSYYHFHANGLVDTTIEAVWDTTGGVGKWMNTTRTVEFYNTGKKSVLTLTDVWLKGDARWLKTSREARVYNTQGLVVVDSSAHWDTTDSKYVYDFLETFGYNSSGKDTSRIHLSYSKSLDDFLNVTRDTYAYDANGNQTSYVHYRWTKNASGGLWLNVSRQTQTYNTKSQIATTLYEAYDSATSNWNKGNYEEWAYEGNDNALSETFSVYDTSKTPDAFVPYKKLTWSYVQMTVGTLPPVAANGTASLMPTLLVTARNAIVTGREGMAVSVFGMNGRRVATVASAKGSSRVVWNFADASGKRVAKGNYILKVSAPGFNTAYQLSICR